MKPSVRRSCFLLLIAVGASSAQLPQAPAPAEEAQGIERTPPGVSTPGSETLDASHPQTLSDTSLQATSVDTKGQIVTLDDVIAMAERSNPRLRGASASVAQANASTVAARAYVNPSVEVFEGEQYARPISTPGVPGLLQHYAVYQGVEVPRERNTRIRTSQLTAEGSHFGEIALTLSVVAEAKRAFYNVLRRREEVAHTQENLQLVEELRRRVQVEVDVGEKGRLELSRAEAELARARFAVRGAQLGLATSIAQLRAAVAASADAPLNPQGSLEPRVTLPPLLALRTAVLNAHPALRESQKNVDAANANLEHERALRIPQPTFFAEFENQPDLRFWRAGATLPLPIFDRRRGRIEGARAGVLQQTAVLDQRRLELISATERAFEAYQLADQEVQSLESGELHAAESAVTASQAAYRFGERGIIDVLDAQRVLQGVRDDLLNAQYARQYALVDLEELGAVTPGGKP